MNSLFTNEIHPIIERFVMFLEDDILEILTRVNKPIHDYIMGTSSMWIRIKYHGLKQTIGYHLEDRKSVV